MDGLDDVSSFLEKESIRVTKGQMNPDALAGFSDMGTDSFTCAELLTGESES